MDLPNLFNYLIYDEKLAILLPRLHGQYQHVSPPFSQAYFPP